MRPPTFRGVPGPTSPLLGAPWHLEALDAVGSGQGNLAPEPQTGDWVAGFLRRSYRLSLRKLPPPRNPAGCSRTRCTLPNGVCRKKASVGNSPNAALRRKAAGRYRYPGRFSRGICMASPKPSPGRRGWRQPNPGRCAFGAAPAVDFRGIRGQSVRPRAGAKFLLTPGCNQCGADPIKLRNPRPPEAALGAAQQSPTVG